MPAMTLRQTIEKNPEYLDLLVVVSSQESPGGFDYVGAAGLVYELEFFDEKEQQDKKVLVFAPN